MAIGDIVKPCVCTGWEIWRMQPWDRSEKDGGRQSVLPRKRDEDGYLLCPFCGKIEQSFLGQLAQCDTCDNVFKGYKLYPKYPYTCPECEAKM